MAHDSVAAAPPTAVLVPMSVVVTAHQRLRQLAPLLDRLLEDEATGEVVIVADGCTDGTDDYLLARAASEPRLRPVLLHPNVGQPRARAAGFAAARHDHVLSLDDDVLPHPELVSGHARWHADPTRRTVVLGYMPTVVPRPRQPGQYPTIEYAEEYERHVQQWQSDPEAIWTSFWAGNFSCSKADFLEAVKGYDFPLSYHEDAELGLRLRNQGAVPVFDTRLRAEHQHERSWQALLSEAERATEAKLELRSRWSSERPFDPDQILRQSSAPVRLAVRTARTRGRLTAALVLLRGASRLAGAARLWTIEAKTARLALFLVMFDTVRTSPAGRRERDEPAATGR